MQVILNDITSLDVDVIVNAANNRLLGGGGVDGRIHFVAGPKLLEECRTLNGCETGNSKMTDAYNLLCKKIIHTVGPVYTGGNNNEANLLKSCYVTSMNLAEQYRESSNLEEITIAFPSISTGIYRFPIEEASKIAINTIKEMDNNRINVIFCCFLEIDYEIYQRNLNELNKQPMKGN